MNKVRHLVKRFAEIHNFCIDLEAMVITSNRGGHTQIPEAGSHREGLSGIHAGFWQGCHSSLDVPGG